jgi:hypothetical protein
VCVCVCVCLCVAKGITYKERSRFNRAG